MKPTKLLLTLLLLLFTLSSQAEAQQNYSGTAAFDCDQHDRTREPSPSFLYTCNGGGSRRSSCLAFLIFVSRPPFDSVSSISALTSSDARAVARINDVAESEDFPVNREVLVPVNCSCSGQYYQGNTTFNVTEKHGTYFTVANEAFEGLTTCNALKLANTQNEQNLFNGFQLQVPLRCACPTRNQRGNGTKYLLTYPIAVGDTVSDLSVRFNASMKDVLVANGLGENQVIHPLTTVLIPLSKAPSRSQTIIRKADEPVVVAPPVPLLQNRGESRSRMNIYKVVAVAAACLMLVVAVSVFAVIIFCRRRDGGVGRRPCAKKKTKVLDDLRMEIASLEHGPRVFSFKELKKATGNFSSKNRVRGSSVYRGNIGGKVLGIKRTMMDVREEVNLLKKLNHFNLMKLLGVCENQGCFFLAFEYMKRGSLNEWLQDCNAQEIHNWSRRVQIALDVAHGLHYLHSFTKPPYVHGYISSSNVLLSCALRAKIGKFSQARAASSDRETKHVVGTIGYMAPEYTESGYMTTEVDVYAFGVVLLELITGKDAVIVRDGKKVLLTTSVAESELGSIIDHRLESYRGAEVMLKIAQDCLMREQFRRPSMEEVVALLSKLQVDLLRRESSSVGVVYFERI